jgi:hypothetical protein
MIRNSIPMVITPKNHQGRISFSLYKTQAKSIATGISTWAINSSIAVK